MDLLFHHGRVSVISGLGTSRQRRCSHHGKEKYVSFYLFHKIIFSLFVIHYSLAQSAFTILDSG
jgi:hypothetical protein